MFKRKVYLEQKAFQNNLELWTIRSICQEYKVAECMCMEGR